MSTEEPIVVDPITELRLGPLRLASDAAQVLDLAWHPRLPVLATSDVSGTVNFYALARPQPKVLGVKGGVRAGKEGHRLLTSLTHHTQSCRSLVFHPHGTHLFTASADGTIGIVECSQSAADTLPQLVTQIKQAHATGINKLVWYDEKLLVSGDDDGFVNVWEFRPPTTPTAPATTKSTAAKANTNSNTANSKLTLKHLLHYRDAGDYISDMYPVPEKNRLCVTSGDGHLYVYDLRPGHIHELLTGKGAAAFAKAKAKGSKKAEFGGKLPNGAVIDTWFAMSDDVQDELSGVLALKTNKKLIVAGREEGVLNIFKWDYFGVPEDHFSLGSSANELEGSGASIDCMIKLDEDTIITGSTDGLIRLVQVHPNKLLSILGTHEDFPIECIQMSPNLPYYFDSAHEPPAEEEADDEDNEDDEEASEDEEDADEPKSKTSNVKKEKEHEKESLVSSLIPRFLASSSHDQTIKFWNCSELFEVDPDEVKEEEEGESDEVDSDADGDEEMGGEEDSDEEEKPKEKAASAKKAPAAAAATVARKRKREPEADEEEEEKTKEEDASDDDDDDDDGDSYPDMSSDSESSQLAGPVGNTNSDEDAEDDEEMVYEDDEEDEEDEDGEDDEESDDGDIGGATSLRISSLKRAPKGTVGAAWNQFLESTGVVPPPEPSSTPAPLPAFMLSANPFAMPATTAPTTTTPATTSTAPTTTTSTKPSPKLSSTPVPSAALKIALTASKITPAALKIAPATSSAATNTKITPAALKIAPAAAPTTTQTAPSSAKPVSRWLNVAAPASSSTATTTRISSASKTAATTKMSEEPSRKKPKTDLNAATGFFSQLPVHHPMHPSQQHKRVGKGELKVEVDNIAKRGDKKRAELQARLVKMKEKKAKKEAKQQAAIERGEDPEMVSSEEDEEDEAPKGKVGKGGKKGGAMSVKRMDSDDSDDDDSDDEGGAKEPKAKKMTSKEKKAAKKAEKRRNPFFAGL